MSGFKGIGIWPLNPRAMDSKIGLSTLYALQNQAKEKEELKQEDGEQEWTKHIAAKKFINMGSTTKATIIGLSKDQPRYYVNMPKIPIITNMHL
jgi:hypothetical protein